MKDNQIKLVRDFQTQPGIDEFEQFANSLTKSVEDNFIKLKPKEDWPPAVFLLNDKRKIHQVMTSLRNNEEKDVFFRKIIPSLIIKTNAFIYGFVSTSWLSTSESDIRPSSDPDRIEVIMIQVISFDKNRTLIAHIKRQKKKHPLLESWEVIDDELQGRHVDPVMKALLQNTISKRRMN
jgi:hypothetical protein